MSISYSPIPDALRVEIKPSNYFRIALIGLTLVALAAVFYAALTWWLRISLSISTLAYGCHCWLLHRQQRGLLRSRSVWFWRGVDGGERALRLRHSTVWPGLIVLTFSDVERKRKMVFTLFADSVEREDARRLRVHLHHFPVFDSDVG